MIPDKEERLAEIRLNPVRLGFLLLFRQLVGEGHDRFVDDMFTSHDGRMVVVSRPSFADVVAISLATRKIVWRFPMEGQRSDHMAVSPDGTRVLVSDLTANKVHELDLRTGRKVGEFPSGDSPHENAFSKDGSRIYNASIGRVFTPTDAPELGPAREASKGERWFQIVDARTMKIIKRWDMGEKLAEAGYDGMDSAVRPMAIAPGDRIAYLQISFLHGFVEFDMQREKVLRVANLPVSEKVKNTPREDYPFDAAHHGLAINPEGTKLCVAGTISDYAAIVSRATFSYKIFHVGEGPYWATTGPEGKRCWVSVSGGDRVVVLDYATERQLASIPVGDKPKRIRAGWVQRALLAKLPQPATPAPVPAARRRGP
jgi:YVTN family beta-propeller protein